MSIALDLTTVQRLVSPTGNKDPLVQALYKKQYQRNLVSLVQLSQKLFAEAPQLAEDSGFAKAFTILKTVPVFRQKRILGYPGAGFWVDVAWNLIHRQSHLRFPQMHIYQHLEEFSRFALAAI